MFDPAWLQQLRERVDTHAVISRHIDLTKSSGSWVGLCPFHAEKTPSFRVYAGDGGFHCFGCQANGDAIAFLQQHASMTFVEAVEQLAGEFGLSAVRVKPPVLQAQAKFKPMAPAKTGHQALDAAQLELLGTWQAALPGSPGAAYLASRRIPLEVAQKLGAGFLPAGGAMGINAEGRPTGYGPRLVLPHTLPGGDVVSLYGRSIDAEADKARRHFHLPRARGLLNAAALELDGPLYVVEGAFDALALMAAGVDKVVALFGLGGFDWRWLRAQHLVIAVDHDDAGNQAARQLMADAAYRGLKAERMAAPGEHKDVAAAWAAGDLPAMSKQAEAPTDVARLRQLVQQMKQPPGRHLQRGWCQFERLATRFCTFGLEAALAAGWTDDELFGLPETSSVIGGGALWALSFFEPERIDAHRDCLVADLGNGRVQRFMREHCDGQAPWVTT